MLMMLAWAAAGAAMGAPIASEPVFIDFERLGRGLPVRILKGNAMLIASDEYASQGFVVEGLAGLFRAERETAIRRALDSVGSPEHLFFGRGELSTGYTIRFTSPVSHAQLTAVWYAPTGTPESARVWPLIEALNAEGGTLGAIALDGAIASAIFENGGTRAYAVADITLEFHEPIGGLRVENGGGLLLDNLRFAPVPAPGSVALLGAGALAMAVRRRRRETVMRRRH